MRGPQSVEYMTQALGYLVDALHLLDEAEAPGEIGAHVDLARERLSRTLEITRVSDSIAREAVRPAA